MQKIKNKFIYFVIFFIFLIILYSVYLSLFEKSIDRNSYVQLVSGEATLNEVPLYINSREQLDANDFIKTVTQDSLAVIEWGDGSITRLGGNTSLKIDELYVSDNKASLNIAFELFSGKTWSNVISYVPEDSYFKETFKDTEASVRGTIFNLDADNDYLYVLDHKVDLVNENGEEKEVTENTPVNLSDFSFIELTEFITSVKDSAFDELNRQLDENFIQSLKDDIQVKLGSLIELSNENIVNLSDEEKEELYNKLLSGYQDINFIGTGDGEDIFNIKLGIKELLLEVSPETEKTELIESFIYDLEDVISNKNYSGLADILIILDKNKEYLNLDILTEINGYLDKLNLKEGVEESIFKNINTFKNSFSNISNFENITNTVEGNIEGAIDKATEIKDSLKGNITESVSSLLNN